MLGKPNQLIKLLHRDDRVRFLGEGEKVQLALKQVLSQPGSATRFVYFPLDSFVSLVVEVDGSPALEVGMVGSEGMVGAHMALGVTTAPLLAIVQGAGSAWRIKVGAFRGELLSNERLQRTLNRYLYVLMAQLASSAGCLRFHQIGPRLARWLLMSQDRADSGEFQMTQEFLSYMLGVRRVGITAAARDLQQRGLIEYHRGVLSVLNRPGLEAMACTCYDSDRRIYSAIMRTSGS